MKESIKKSDKVLTYQYKFTFKDGSEKAFTVKLKAQTLDLIVSEQGIYPAWTNLGHCQCPNCPLNEAEHRFCPIAINLVDLVEFFKRSVSYEEVQVVINSDIRVYMKQTSLQEGVSSLLGIYMVTSGCPIMDKLRPMVLTHLPFGTTQETTYRLLSMYLLAQFFVYKRGREPDWDFKKLKKIFEDIQVVNRYFWNRFASVKIEDASLNALIHLDNVAQYVAFSVVDENLLSETELLFMSYFD